LKTVLLTIKIERQEVNTNAK
jgi:hypothetical protein